MAEQARPLITPDLLKQLRLEQKDEAYQPAARSVLTWLPYTLAYDIVLRQLLSECTQFDLRVTFQPGINLARLESACKDQVNTHLGTVVDLDRYRWQFVWGQKDHRGLHLALSLIRLPDVIPFLHEPVIQ
jgi:hypothetical protein